MMANTVEDPNQDPNLYSEIDVSSFTLLTNIELLKVATTGIKTKNNWFYKIQPLKINDKIIEPWVKNMLLKLIYLSVN